MKAAPRSGPASVVILMATFQGQDFLAEQLDSVAAQTYPHWRLHASDDGSSDRTGEMLAAFRVAQGGDRVTVTAGPGRGIDANFRSLVASATLDADMYAFSDQDDIWEPDKLARAVQWLSARDPGRPALYCSRTRLIDRQGTPIGASPRFTRPPSFANALVQNIAGGNTMVFNKAALSLLRQAQPASTAVVIYDWWTYLLVTGAGGEVAYDLVPSVRYRQHGDNAVGANVRLGERVGNVGHMLKGRLRDWTDRHVKALEQVRDVLTPENRERFERFAAARDTWLVPRLLGFQRAGLYRQTTGGNLGIVLAALLNRL